MKYRLISFCLLMLLSVLVGGCCKEAAVFPTGAYLAQVMDEEVILDITIDGSYTAVQAGRALITRGTYRRAGDTITFGADPPCVEEATYTWTLDDQTLTFEASGEDLCRERQAYLEDVIYNCISCT